MVALREGRRAGAEQREGREARASRREDRLAGDEPPERVPDEVQRSRSEPGSDVEEVRGETGQGVGGLVVGTRGLELAALV